MNNAPKDGTWILAKRKSGRELAVSWMKPVGSIFLGQRPRWITDTGKAGEVLFDCFVIWRQLP